MLYGVLLWVLHLRHHKAEVANNGIFSGFIDSMTDPDYWRKQALTAEANAVYDVATGQKSIDEAGTDYATGKVTGNLLDSATNGFSYLHQNLIH